MGNGENELKDRLRKVEALFRRAGTAGEREAAKAALDRLKAKISELNGPEDPTEWTISRLDFWSEALFQAVCRRHGVQPYRKPRQRKTNIKVFVRAQLLNEVIWPEYERLRMEQLRSFQQTTQGLIQRHP